MYKYKIIISFSVLILSSLSAKAQEQNTIIDARKIMVQDTLKQEAKTPVPDSVSISRDYRNVFYNNSSTSDALFSIAIPPLDLLFENAEKTPAVLSKEKLIEYERLMLKKQKRQWLNFFSVFGHYQWGNGIVYSSLFDENNAAIPQQGNYNMQIRNTFNVGGSIVIPLEGLLDLGGKVKRQRLQIEALEQEKLFALEERKLEIADIYSNISRYIAILSNAIELITHINTQYAIFENDYINGLHSAGELSFEKGRVIEANNRYEVARAELYGALLRLEILSNTVIISDKKIEPTVVVEDEKPTKTRRKDRSKNRK